MTDPTVEAVARAICARDGHNPDDEIEGACDGPCPPMWMAYIGQATAAIEALKALGWKPPQEERR